MGAILQAHVRIVRAGNTCIQWRLEVISALTVTMRVKLEPFEVTVVETMKAHVSLVQKDITETAM